MHFALDPRHIYKSFSEVAYSGIQLGRFGESFNRDVGSGVPTMYLGIKGQVRPGVRCNGKEDPSTGILPPERTKRRWKLNKLLTFSCISIGFRVSGSGKPESSDHTTS